MSTALVGKLVNGYFLTEEVASKIDEIQDLMLTASKIDDRDYKFEQACCREQELGFEIIEELKMDRDDWFGFWISVERFFPS